MAGLEITVLFLYPSPIFIEHRWGVVLGLPEFFLCLGDIYLGTSESYGDVDLQLMVSGSVLKRIGG
ncbi:hypothetical protein M1N12_02700, partial [Peptococcaceae bacterium]|nr:hypothetical protein [Peptococcaceae bacterium]